MIGFLPTGDAVDCGPKCFGIPSISMKLVLKIDVFKLSIKVVGSLALLVYVCVQLCVCVCARERGRGRERERGRDGERERGGEREGVRASVLMRYVPVVETTSLLERERETERGRERDRRREREGVRLEFQKNPQQT